MKVAVIIVGLMVVAVAYGTYGTRYDASKCRSYSNMIKECTKELGKNACIEDILLCSFRKYGILSSSGKYILRAGIKGLREVIRNIIFAKRAMWIARTCYYQADKQRITDSEKTKRIIHCGIGRGMLDLISKDC